jgi:hypothetical protein
LAPSPGFGEQRDHQQHLEPPSNQDIDVHQFDGERAKAGATSTAQHETIDEGGWQDGDHCGDAPCMATTMHASFGISMSQRSEESPPSNMQEISSSDFLDGMIASSSQIQFVDSGELQTATSTFQSEVEDSFHVQENIPALAPDNDDLSSSSTTALSGRIKMMKTTSKSQQFYTTIVVLVCINTREFLGFSGIAKRAANIFKKVECGLRDRVLFPLPADVSLKDLMSFSFFKGPGAEDQFRLYCVSCLEPLSKEMVEFADRLYNHKFTDIKKHITNHVQPKYIAILKKLTGDGMKSG